jgi:hypothetical protein
MKNIKRREQEFGDDIWLDNNWKTAMQEALKLQREEFEKILDEIRQTKNKGGNRTD